MEFAEEDLREKEAEAAAEAAAAEGEDEPKGSGMSETEERMADLLEAAQEAKPLADAAEAEGDDGDVFEEQANATEPEDDPEFRKEIVGEEERCAVIPELPVGGGSGRRKRRRGRRGRRDVGMDGGLEA